MSVWWNDYQPDQPWSYEAELQAERDWTHRSLNAARSSSYDYTCHAPVVPPDYIPSYPWLEAAVTAMKQRRIQTPRNSSPSFTLSKVQVAPSPADHQHHISPPARPRIQLLDDALAAEIEADSRRRNARMCLVEGAKLLEMAVEFWDKTEPLGDNALYAERAARALRDLKRKARHESRFRALWGRMKSVLEGED